MEVPRQWPVEETRAVAALMSAPVPGLLTVATSLEHSDILAIFLATPITLVTLLKREMQCE